MSVALGTGDWSHIAMTYDGSTQKLYVNGSLAASAALSGSINQDANSLLIGQFFNGMLDEVAIYNRALSATEVKDHYYGFVDKGMIDSPGAVKEYGEN